MVRASAAEMLKLFGGTYPPGHDATSFGNLAVYADALIDGYSLPAVCPTVGAPIVGVANRIAVHLVQKAMWLSAGGILSGQEPPVIMTKDLKDIIDKVNMDTTADGFWALDTIDEDD